MGEIEGRAEMTAEGLSERLFGFACTVVRVVDALPGGRVSAKVVGTQCLRAATSAAANYEEARGAVSRADFAAKLGIAYKECRESVFWIRLMAEAGIVDADQVGPLAQEARELRAILGASLKTTRSRTPNKKSRP